MHVCICTFASNVHARQKMNTPYWSGILLCYRPWFRVIEASQADVWRVSSLIRSQHWKQLADCLYPVQCVAAHLLRNTTPAHAHMRTHTRTPQCSRLNMVSDSVSCEEWGHRCWVRLTARALLNIRMTLCVFVMFFAGSQVYAVVYCRFWLSINHFHCLTAASCFSCDSRAATSAWSAVLTLTAAPVLSLSLISIPGYLSQSLSLSGLVAAVVALLSLPLALYRSLRRQKGWGETVRDTRDFLPQVCMALRVNLLRFWFPKPNNCMEMVFILPFSCCDQNRMLTWWCVDITLRVCASPFQAFL